MIFAIAILLSAVVVNSQDVLPIRDYRVPPHYSPYYHDESPKPYSFSYNAPLEDGVGQSSRTEVADGTGAVQGSYTVTNDEGHTRVVDYVADHTGFRANIRTNEPGTENKNPADVTIHSEAPYIYGPYQYNPRRPFRAGPVDPAVPVPPAEVLPETLGAPALYNNPNIYANRNRLYRPRGRYPYY